MRTRGRERSCRRIGDGMNIRVAICLLAAIVPIAAASAQEPATVLTLAQATDAALAQGADSRILAKTLDIGREQYRLSVSQNSFSLSGSVGESGTYGFGDDTLLGSNLLASGFSQTPQAGLSLSGPLTNVGVTITPYQPASALASEFAPLLSFFSPPGTSIAVPGPTGSVNLSLSQTLWNGYPAEPARRLWRKACSPFAAGSSQRSPAG